jgi:hypothetical protein
MCGEIPEGCSAHTVSVRLLANQNRVTVRFNRQFKRVKSVWLDEYVVRLPTGGAVNPSFFLLKFGDHLATDHINNLDRAGYPIAINNSTLTHVVYQRPRVISAQEHGGLSSFQIEVQTPTAGAAVFDEIILWMTIVVKDGHVNYDAQRAEMANLPRFTDYQNDYRNPEFSVPVSQIVAALQQAVKSGGFSAPKQNECSRCGN